MDAVRGSKAKVKAPNMLTSWSTSKKRNIDAFLESPSTVTASKSLKSLDAVRPSTTSREPLSTIAANNAVKNMTAGRNSTPIDKVKKPLMTMVNRGTVQKVLSEPPAPSKKTTIVNKSLGLTAVSESSSTDKASLKRSTANEDLTADEESTTTATTVLIASEELTFLAKLVIFNDISVLIQWLAWTCLSLTSRALKNLEHEIAFPTQSAMENLMQRIPFQFAPGLLQTLQSPIPPTISYFKTLPLHLEKLWAVYLLVLEHEDPARRPRIYIGSGTEGTYGIRKRMSQYDKRIQTGAANSAIPHYVETSLQEGYNITHKCLLCWAALPMASDVFQLRCLFLILESVFALCFWAMRSRTKDYFMPALCPWSRESFTYDGCCNHFSINEQIGAHHEDATPEEINRLAAERKAASVARREANRVPGAKALTTKACAEKHLEEQNFKCDVCIQTFDCDAKLSTHLLTPLHLKKVQEKATGVRKVLKGSGGSPRAVANKTHWCEPCQHAACSAKRLETHLNGKPHAKKLRVLAAAAAAAATASS